MNTENENPDQQPQECSVDILEDISRRPDLKPRIRMNWLDRGEVPPWHLTRQIIVLPVSCEMIFETGIVPGIEIVPFGGGRHEIAIVYRWVVTISSDCTRLGMAFRTGYVREIFGQLNPEQRKAFAFALSQLSSNLRARLMHEQRDAMAEENLKLVEIADEFTNDETRGDALEGLVGDMAIPRR